MPESGEDRLPQDRRGDEDIHAAGGSTPPFGGGGAALPLHAYPATAAAEPPNQRFRNAARDDAPTTDNNRRRANRRYRVVCRDSSPISNPPAPPGKPSNIVDLYGPPQRRGKLAPREVTKGNRLLLPTNPKEEK